jgi:hypothetical protein
MELYYDGLVEMVCFAYIECIYGMGVQKAGKYYSCRERKEGKHNSPVFEKLETIAYGFKHALINRDPR